MDASQLGQPRPVTLQEHFEFTSNNPDDHSDIMVRLGFIPWEREGEYVQYVILDIAGLAEAAAHDLTELLRKIHYSYPDEKDDSLNPYGFEALYEERVPDTEKFVKTRDEFRYGIQSRARFFNELAKAALNEIFGGTLGGFLTPGYIGKYGAEGVECVFRRHKVMGPERWDGRGLVGDFRGVMQCRRTAWTG